MDPRVSALSRVCIFGQGIKVEALQCGLIRERIYNKIQLVFESAGVSGTGIFAQPMVLLKNLPISKLLVQHSLVMFRGTRGRCER